MPVRFDSAWLQPNAHCVASANIAKREADENAAAKGGANAGN